MLKTGNEYGVLTDFGLGFGQIRHKRTAVQGCTLLLCVNKREASAAVYVNEVIDDGSWRTPICQDCADRLGLKDHDVLPGYDEQKRLLGSSEP